VMEKTEEISKYVSLLRKSLLHRLHLVKQQQQLLEQQQQSQFPHQHQQQQQQLELQQQQQQQAKERQERKAVNELFEEVEDSHTGTMSLEDFRRMLVRLQMFLDKPIWLGMFAWIDLNHDGSISLEVGHLLLPSLSDYPFPPTCRSSIDLCCHRGRQRRIRKRRNSSTMSTTKPSSPKESLLLQQRSKIHFLLLELVVLMSHHSLNSSFLLSIPPPLPPSSS
jgi:Ca2+-binding EF-hand superfamily protein